MPSAAAGAMIVVSKKSAKSAKRVVLVALRDSDLNIDRFIFPSGVPYLEVLTEMGGKKFQKNS